MVQNVRFMDGKVGSNDFGFLDLVKDMQAAKATGIFEVTHGAEGKGKLIVKDGLIISADLELPAKKSIVLRGRKAFLRIVLWSVGRFKFTAEPISEGCETELEGEDLIAAARQEQEMLERFLEYLPDKESNLKLVNPLVAKLSDLSPEALDTLQLAMNHSRVRHVINKGTASDLEVYQDILYLLQNGYVTNT